MAPENQKGPQDTETSLLEPKAGHRVQEGGGGKGSYRDSTAEFQELAALHTGPRLWVARSAPSPHHPSTSVDTEQKNKNKTK